MLLASRQHDASCTCHKPCRASNRVRASHVLLTFGTLVLSGAAAVNPTIYEGVSIRCFVNP